MTKQYKTEHYLHQKFIILHEKAITSKALTSGHFSTSQEVKPWPWYSAWICSRNCIWSGSVAQRMTNHIESDHGIPKQLGDQNADHREWPITAESDQSQRKWPITTGSDQSQRVTNHREWPITESDQSLKVTNHYWKWPITKSDHGMMSSRRKSIVPSDYQIDAEMKSPGM